MRSKLGIAIIATGVLHIGIGILGTGQLLRDMAADGVFNSVSPHLDRAAAVWFFMAGGFLILIGLTVNWCIARTGTLPLSLGVSMLVMSVIGVVLMPTSGFWLVLIESVIAIRVARISDRQARERPLPVR